MNENEDRHEEAAGVIADHLRRGPGLRQRPRPPRGSLGALVLRDPEAQVRLHFRNDDGEGTLELAALDALEPNAKGWYFPPRGTTWQQLGWPQPYWFQSEIVGVEVVRDTLSP